MEKKFMEEVLKTESKTWIIWNIHTENQFQQILNKLLFKNFLIKIAGSTF